MDWEIRQIESRDEGDQHSQQGWCMVTRRDGVVALWLFLLFLADGRAAMVVAQQPMVTATLVFDGVTVIDVEQGKRLPGQRVVIAGTRIQALGSPRTVPLPRGAQVVDARGKYLIPGLWDMHVHPLHYVDISYPLLIANGVTGVRDAGSDVPLATLGQWKREIAQGVRVGPRLFVAGPAVDEGERDTTRRHHLNVTTWEVARQRIDTARARRVVDSLHASGADFIKTYGLSEAMYYVIAAEARRLGMPFGGHLPVRVTIDDSSHRVFGPGAPDIGLRVSDSGARFIDHGLYMTPDPCGLTYKPDEFDAEKCGTILKRLRRNDTWIVMGGGRGFPEMVYEWSQRYLPATVTFAGSVYRFDFSRLPRGAERAPTSFGEWVARSTQEHGEAPSNRWQRLEAFNYPLLLGTDANALNADGLGFLGFTVHNGLTNFVMHGMSSLWALQTATLNPARALHATDSLGTVEAGKLADLVLLDGDPLEDIWNTRKIRAVVANGRYFDRSALDHLLTEAEHAAHR